jgi:hypothetical protein
MDDQNVQDQDVVEAEVVADTAANGTPAPAGDGQANVLLSLEEMIKKYITRLDNLKVEIKKHKEMYDDSFNNNPTFIENTEKAKEAAKDLKTTKKNIASQPGVIQIALKLKSMRDEAKEMHTSLSDYLLEYQRMTGANEIEGEDGKLRDIINNAKLVVRSAKS